MKKELLIEGMSCNHCVMHVEKALNALDGVSAKVDLASKKATVTLTHDVPDELLKQAVADAGYEVVAIR
ncbi:Copper chaperone CopZ [bioreactor metagenome]|uniref:Copper chaperone CopZ n=1 Tax=bioreactor metagenome TaxID=1076179 RepID=A0A645HUH4_9ZZZZ